jgi:hypothetical protein
MNKIKIQNINQKNSVMKFTKKESACLIELIKQEQNELFSFEPVSPEMNEIKNKVMATIFILKIKIQTLTAEENE